MGLQISVQGAVPETWSRTPGPRVYFVLLGYLGRTLTDTNRRIFIVAGTIFPVESLNVQKPQRLDERLKKSREDKSYWKGES